MNEYEAHLDTAPGAAHGRQSPLPPPKPITEEIVAARGLLAARKNADAASLLAASAHKDPTGEADGLLGDALFALERYPEAAHAYEKAGAKGFAGEGLLGEKLEAARTNAYVGAELDTGHPPTSWSEDRPLEQRPSRSQEEVDRPEGCPAC